VRFVWVLFVGALVLVSCAASVETAVGSRSASSSSAAVSMTVPPMMSSDISVSSESSPEEIEAKLQAMADSDFEESTNEYHSTASCDNQFPDAKTISVNKFVDDEIDKRFKSGDKDKDFSNAVEKVAKRVIQALFDMHYKRNNLVKNMPVPKG